jgi:DNA-directed RNA polymerase subunit beta'
MRLAGDKQVRAWSSGQVKKPETLNYRTFRPEKDGLFCEEIFGAFPPLERGGPDTQIGHIELCQPVVHPWFRTRLAQRLGVSVVEVNALCLGERAMVMDPGPSSLTRGQLVTIAERESLLDDWGGDVTLATGTTELRAVLGAVADEVCLNAVPVCPPSIRPMQYLEDKLIQTHGLSDLYRRMVNRANRLRRLVELNAPEIIVINEARMQQEAFDALIENGEGPKVIKGTQGERLPSLFDAFRAVHGETADPLAVDYPDTPLMRSLALTGGTAGADAPTTNASDDLEFD